MIVLYFVIHRGFVSDSNGKIVTGPRQNKCRSYALLSSSLQSRRLGRLLIRVHIAFQDQRYTIYDPTLKSSWCFVPSRNFSIRQSWHNHCIIVIRHLTVRAYFAFQDAGFKLLLSSFNHSHPMLLHCCKSHFSSVVYHTMIIGLINCKAQSAKSRIGLWLAISKDRRLLCSRLTIAGRKSRKSIGQYQISMLCCKSHFYIRWSSYDNCREGTRLWGRVERQRSRRSRRSRRSCSSGPAGGCFQHQRCLRHVGVKPAKSIGQ